MIAINRLDMRLSDLFEAPETPEAPKPIRLSGFGVVSGRVDDFLLAFDEMSKSNPLDVASRIVYIGDRFVLVEFKATRDPRHVVHLSAVRVPEEFRKQGLAGQIMRTICDLADRYNVSITLTPKGFGGETAKPRMSDTRLASWYQSMGFVPDRQGMLIRPPKVAS